MKRYIKWYLWFMKESYSFMQGHNVVWITFSGLVKAHAFAKDMCAWNKATPQQRENWYVSGEGRTIEFD